MVAYNVGNNDPNTLPLGTYYVETTIPSRGENKGNVSRRVFQVRHKTKNGEPTQYWHLVNKTMKGMTPEDSEALILVDGLPPPLSARLLKLIPGEEAIQAYENGKYVTLSTAWNHMGEEPTSFFVLKRRKDGDDYLYTWSRLGRAQLAKQNKPASDSARARKPRAPRKKKEVELSLTV